MLTGTVQPIGPEARAFLASSASGRGPSGPIKSVSTAAHRSAVFFGLPLAASAAAAAVPGSASATSLRLPDAAPSGFAVAFESAVTESIAGAPVAGFATDAATGAAAVALEAPVAEPGTEAVDTQEGPGAVPSGGMSGIAVRAIRAVAVVRHRCDRHGRGRSASGFFGGKRHLLSFAALHDVSPVVVPRDAEPRSQCRSPDALAVGRRLAGGGGCGGFQGGGCDGCRHGPRWPGQHLRGVGNRGGGCCSGWCHGPLGDAIRAEGRALDGFHAAVAELG
mmetsp:Transcript_27184/g.90396  ORF Transcript_27184/g.90396 Transcript_27184/m.90396 type:complete len:278 (+) Transcript_27184:563-1396(+)